MGLQKYINFTSITPDELSTEAETESETETAKQLSVRNWKIVTCRLSFRKYLQSKPDLSEHSVRSVMNAVKSFYFRISGSSKVTGRCYIRISELHGMNLRK
jgi:hypothetical protein